MLNVDMFNALNANPVLTENSNFAVWRHADRDSDGALRPIQRSVRLLTGLAAAILDNLNSGG